MHNHEECKDKTDQKKGDSCDSVTAAHNPKQSKEKMYFMLSQPVQLCQAENKWKDKSEQGVSYDSKPERMQPERMPGHK